MTKLGSLSPGLSQAYNLPVGHCRRADADYCKLHQLVNQVASPIVDVIQLQIGLTQTPAISVRTPVCQMTCQQKINEVQLLSPGRESIAQFLQQSCIILSVTFPVLHIILVKTYTVGSISHTKPREYIKRSKF